MLTITDKGRDYLDTMQERALDPKAPESDDLDMVVLFVLEEEDLESTDWILARVFLYEKRIGGGKSSISKSRIEDYKNSIRRLFEAGYIEEY